MIVGAALAFAAAIQPGPFQAYLLSRVAAIGWRRTLPAAFAPLISDGPIALIALLVLGQLSVPMQSVLRLAGGLLLFYFAWGTYRQWGGKNAETAMQSDKVPRTLFEAALVNVLNPNPYLGWALILGPVVVAAWREAPRFGIAVVVAFYATMITTVGITIVAFGSSRFLGPKYQRMLLLVSALILTALGMYQITLGIQFLAALQT